jgi:hypothetical protein
MPEHDPNIELPPNRILTMVAILLLIGAVVAAYILVGGDPWIAPRPR